MTQLLEDEIDNFEDYNVGAKPRKADKVHKRTGTNKPRNLVTAWKNSIPGPD